MTKSIYQKEFEEYLQSTLGISKNTLKSYRSDIRHFLTWLGVARIEDACLRLNAIEANAYKSYLSSSNTPIKTINRHLSSLRHLSRFLIAKKYIQKNFMETIGNAGTLHNPVLAQTTYNPVKTRSINIKPLLAVAIIAFFLLFLGKSGIAKEGISIVASKLGISLPSMQENTASSTIEPSVLAESVSKDLSFDVNINTNLLKDLSVGGNATVSGTLTTTGDLTTEGSLTSQSVTTGVVTAGAITGTTALFTGNITVPSIVTNATTFNLVNTNATTLNIGGAATTISLGAASGTSTVNNDLAVKGKLTVSGTSALTGDVTASGALTVSGSTTLSGATTVGSTLTVSGNATFGNITGVNGVTYSFPAAQGVLNSVLTNDASGNLTWTSLAGAGGVTGTGSANQITFWSGTSTVIGSNNFTWNNGTSTFGVTGTTNLLGSTTLGGATTDLITFTGRVASGTSLLPAVNLGSDLGSSSLKWNNIYAANLNIDSGVTSSGQLLVTYNPTDTTFAQSSIRINVTTPAADEQMLGIGQAGEERAAIDAEGDMTLGYDGVAGSSVPTNSNPLAIYNHGTTEIMTVLANGNVGIGTTNPGAKLDVSTTANSGKVFQIVDGTSEIVSVTSGGGEGIINFSNSSALYMRAYGSSMRIGTADYFQFDTNGTERDYLNVYGLIGGTHYDTALNLANTVTMSGANGYTGIKLNITESTIGTGNNRLIDLQRGGNSQFFVDRVGTGYFAGNVGIGATNPTQTLQVNGQELIRFSGAGCTNCFQVIRDSDSTVYFSLNGTTINASQFKRYVFNGTGSGPFLTFSADNGLGAGAAQTYIQLGGIASDHSITGTSTIVNITSGQFQPNSGNANLVGLNINPIINQSGTASGNYTALLVNPTQTSFLGTTGYIADFQIGNASKMVIRNDGNVGIGVTNPGGLLDVKGVTGSVIVDSQGTLLASADIKLNQSGPRILNNSTGNLRIIGGSSGGLPITLNETGGGFVGIGTTNPLNALSVVKTNAGADSEILKLSNLSDTNGTASSIAFTSFLGTVTTGKITNTRIASGTYDLSFYSYPGLLGGGLTEGMRLTSTGNVGIGVTNPLNTLDISSSSTSTASAMVRNTSTNSAIAGLAIKLSSTTLDNTSRFVNFLDLNGTIIGKIQAADTTSVNYAANGTDMAEYFTKDSSVFTPGDLVSQGTNGATLTTSTYDSKMIGIVSTAPSFTGGVEGPNKVLVALVGQVPVKISSTSQPINPGDYITSSSEAGKAMKAINPGYTIGKALEAWDPASGKTTISVAIHNSYFEGDLSGQIAQLKTDVANLTTDISLMKLSTQSASIATDSATFTNMTVLGSTVLADTVVNGKLNIGMLTLDNVNSSIDAIGTLKLQSLALGSIEFEGGNIVMEANGNIAIKQGVILGNSKIRDSIDIYPGQTQIYVSQAWDTPPVSIQVTPTYKTSVWVTNITKGGFTINVDPSPAQPQKLLWWAIW